MGKRKGQATPSSSAQVENSERAMPARWAEQDWAKEFASLPTLSLFGLAVRVLVLTLLLGCALWTSWESFRWISSMDANAPSFDLAASSDSLRIQRAHFVVPSDNRSGDDDDEATREAIDEGLQEQVETPPSHFTIHRDALWTEGGGKNSPGHLVYSSVVTNAPNGQGFRLVRQGPDISMLEPNMDFGGTVFPAGFYDRTRPTFVANTDVKDLQETIWATEAASFLCVLLLLYLLRLESSRVQSLLHRKRFKNDQPGRRFRGWLVPDLLHAYLELPEGDSIDSRENEREDFRTASRTRQRKKGREGQLRLSWNANPNLIVIAATVGIATMAFMAYFQGTPFRQPSTLYLFAAWINLALALAFALTMAWWARPRFLHLQANRMSLRVLWSEERGFLDELSRPHVTEVQTKNGVFGRVEMRRKSKQKRQALVELPLPIAHKFVKQWIAATRQYEMLLNHKKKVDRKLEE